MNEASSAPATSVVDRVTAKSLVDAFLAEHFNQRIAEAVAIDPSFEQLWQTIRDIGLAGGKRLRPYMTMLVYSAYSGRPGSDILPAASAEELLHLAMLIHDDIIDRDDVRYGVQNVSGTYFDHYETLVSDENERRHFSTSAAILAGDLLLSDAHWLLTQATARPETNQSVQKLLSVAVFSVIGGELLDTEASFKKLASAHPHVIAQYKTASYSFVMPLLMGATLADAPASERELLQEIGEVAGIAYQMRDDILGTFGDEKVTGKSADGDIREGKRTLLSDEFLRRATDDQKLIFAAAFGNQGAAEPVCDAYRSILRESGAVAAIEESIEQALQTADGLINRLALSDQYKTALRELVTLSLKRDK
jgi:geranylgeranyl pyrophosphate synthase